MTDLQRRLALRSYLLRTVPRQFCLVPVEQARRAGMQRHFGPDEMGLGPDELKLESTRRFLAVQHYLGGPAPEDLEATPPAGYAGRREPVFVVSSLQDPEKKDSEVVGWEALASCVDLSANTCRVYCSRGVDGFSTRRHVVKRKI
jgi:hypothetical protein